MKSTKLLLIASSIGISVLSSAQTLADGVITDGHTYEVDAMTGITCTNKWIIDRVHNGETFLGLQFVKDYAVKARTAAIDTERGKVYVGYSKSAFVINGTDTVSNDYAHLVVFDLKTGTLEKELPLTCDGVAISGLLCANQVGCDDAGNIWLCGMYSDVNAKPAQIYVVEDFETGACKNVGQWKLPYDEVDAAGRIDYWDVVGDITGETANAVCMGAVGTTAGGEKLCLYRWELAQGETEWVANEDYFAGYVSYYDGLETYPAGQVTWGQSATTVKIVAEEGHAGSLFYVDGFTTCPSLYNTSMQMVESFASAPDLAPAVGCNGIEEFTFNGKHYIAYVENQHNVSPGCRIRVCELGNDGTFGKMRLLWNLPETGLGEVSDGGTRVHNICAEKVVDEFGGESIYILTYKCNNGLGLYCISIADSIKEDLTIIDGIAYQIIDGTNNVRIFGNTGSLASTLTIPSTVTINDISYNVTEINARAFSGCTDLTSITIPSSVTFIGDYAFNSCSNISTIFYNAKNCQTMGTTSSPAFNLCENVTTLIVGDNVESIPDYAFNGLTNLNTIVSLNTTAPICQSNTFANYTPALYVPKDSFAKYFIDEIWGLFDNLIKIETLVSSITISDNILNLTIGETYQLSALVEPLNASLTNVIWSSDNSSVVSVNSVGRISCLSEGKATITAKSIDGSNVIANCEISVSKITAETISLSQTDVTIKIGDVVNISCEILPGNTTDKSINWVATNNDVVSISRNSDNSVTITGRSAGSTTLIASTNDGSNLIATCRIVVSSGKVQTITLSQTDVSLPVNEVTTLSYAVEPSDALDKSVTWSTSDKTIAGFKENNDGSITIVGVSVGDAIITALTNDGSNLSASCIIKVTDFSGVNEINNSDAVEVARYNVYGRLLSEPTKGINIVKMSDGTVKKIVIN